MGRPAASSAAFSHQPEETVMKPKKYPIALNLPTVVALLILLGRHIVQAMGLSSWFAAPNPLPNPTLATISSHLDALETAEATALGRGKGAAAARNVAKKQVTDDLAALKAYVSMIVALNIASALAIIEAAGMTSKRYTAPQKAMLAAVMGAVPLQVVLRAKAAGKGAVYGWEYSINAGTTWIAMPMTNVAHTTLSGATQGTTYLFRYCFTLKNVTSAWSQTISLFVH
jgi:hypothetical protein